MATVWKLTKPGQGRGPGCQTPLSPSGMSHFLPCSWDRHLALQEHNGSAHAEMALLAAPLSRLSAPAFLSHSDMRCFPSSSCAQCSTGDEGPNKGNSEILRCHWFENDGNKRSIIWRVFFLWKWALLLWNWLGMCWGIRSEGTCHFLSTSCVLEIYHVVLLDSHSNF